MTTDTIRLKSAYQRTGLSFLGITFEKAMATKAIRISLECAVKAAHRKSHQGNPAPIQPALI